MHALLEWVTARVEAAEAVPFRPWAAVKTLGIFGYAAGIRSV